MKVYSSFFHGILRNVIFVTGQICNFITLKRAATNDYFHYRLICRLFLHLTDLSHIPLKYQKSAKNAYLNFSEQNVTSSNGFFCPNNSPKHKESSFFINDSEKQQILTFKRLNQQFFKLFYLKND